MNLKEDVKFLYEVGSLRYVDRTWKQNLWMSVANVTEHSFRVMWIAQVIAKHEWADISKVTQLALVHDISEIRSVDVGYISRQYVTRHEDEAYKDTFKDTVLEEYYAPLIEEVKTRSTLEAKIVKDADNLDCDLELQEMWYVWLKSVDYWNKKRTEHVRNKLFTQTAKDMFDHIIGSNPNDWHTEWKNRFNQGDWKKL